MSDGTWALINVAAAVIPTVLGGIAIWWAVRREERANERHLVRLHEQLWSRTR